MTKEQYEPSYDTVCTVCSQTPVVVAVSSTKERIELDLCGPCCFGTARALDVDWWNAENQNTR